MKCFECNLELEALKERRYRYVESGLTNIYLTGVTVLRCAKCNTEIPELPNIKSLHLCIALAIIEGSPSLSGEEIRFLRKNLGMKSKDLAAKLGYEPEVFSKYENNRLTIGDHADRSIRMWYLIQKSKEVENYKSLIQAVDNFDKIGEGTIWRKDIEIPIASCFANRASQIQSSSTEIH